MQDAGGGLGGRLRIQLAVGRRGVAVLEAGRSRQRQRALQQGLVELEDLGAVLQLGLGGRIRGADAHVAGVPGGRRLAGVEFLLQPEVDQIACPGCGAQRAHVRVDAGDTGDDDIGARQVELRAQHQCHRGGRGVGVAHARRHHAHAARGALHIGVLSRQTRHAHRSRGRQLGQPGRGLGAEQRDDEHLHGNGRRHLGRDGGQRGHGDEQRCGGGAQRNEGRTGHGGFLEEVATGIVHAGILPAVGPVGQPSNQPHTFK